MQTYLDGKPASRPAVTSAGMVVGHVSSHRHATSLDNAVVQGYVPYRLIGLQNLQVGAGGRSDDGRRDVEAENE